MILSSKSKNAQAIYWYPHSCGPERSWNKIQSPLCPRPRQDRVKMQSIPRRDRDLQKVLETKTDLEYYNTGK